MAPSPLPTPTDLVVDGSTASAAWPPQAWAVVIAAGIALIGVFISTRESRKSQLAAENVRHQNALDAESVRHQNSLDADERRHRHALEVERQQRLADQLHVIYAELEARRLALHSAVTVVMNFGREAGPERSSAITRAREEMSAFNAESADASLFASRSVQRAVRRTYVECWRLLRAMDARDDEDEERLMASMLKVDEALTVLHQLLRAEVGAEPIAEEH